MIHPFPDRLRTELYGYRGSESVLQLTHVFSYYHPDLPHVTVPAGSLTDGASIPKVLHSIAGPYGPYFRGAVIHDHLYSQQSCEFYSYIDRKTADDIFWHAILDCGCGKAVANCMWAAVRSCGWRPYKRQGKPIRRV